jgi:ketosteroid isomerase-like protein
VLKTMMATAAALLATATATLAQSAPASVSAAPVVAAERAFAARAAAVGVAPSFLEYMTDDAIVFSPDPLLARAVYGAGPPPKAPKDGGTLLNWWPNFAGIARSGDLGFTTGPATVNGAAPGVFYFTVWTRQPDGRWKWVYDGGVEADGRQAPGPNAEPILLPPGDARVVAPDTAVLAPDARVQGSAAGPATDPAAVDRELATRAPTIAFGPLGGSASKAGDLAWTYGDARWGKGRGHYVRVWQRRAGKWALVFDQILEVPPAAAKVG